MADATSRGYRFPESTDPVRPYLDIENLAQDVSDDIDTLEAAWTTYTPVYGAGGGSPTIGTGGTITGRYKKIGRMCTVSVLLQFGTSPNFGTGGWTITVPFTSANVNNVRHIGSMVLRDDTGGGTGWYLGSAMLAANSSTLLVFGGNAGQQVTGTAPFTWAANDVLWLTLTYETAS